VRGHAVAALTFSRSVGVYIGMILVGVQATSGSPYTIPFLLFVNLLLAFNWRA
jgi:hypothetical protein